jgi:two-component sensor histidine kinase
MVVNLVNRGAMSAERIDEALARINVAMSRIDAARLELQASSISDEKPDAPGSARVMALVNAHEKLREEVADTLGELDTLIEELEGE